MSSNNRLSVTLVSLIQILRDGGIHSGESLGKKLGVSRAAIWKQLNRLKQQGIPFETIKGQGYRVPNGLDLLDIKDIKDALPQSIGHLVKEIIYSPIVTSTNQILLDRIRQQQYAHQVVCVTEMQTAGRGRRGRSWESPFAGNLYLSLAWQFEQGIAALEGLSLVVGLAIYRALSKLNIQVGLKWPNDLLYQGKKLGGVLIEISGDVSGECFVVIGIGLNIKMPHSSGEKIDQPWIDLQTIVRFNGLTPHLNRSALVALILEQLMPMLDHFASSGFAPFRREWQAVHVYHGKSVTLTSGSRQVTGKVLGVNDNGALRLQTRNGEQLLVGGEISLRGS